MTWLSPLMAKIGVPYARRRLREWRMTPYDNNADQYDVFLSYKSEDVEVVRHVADRLIAHGLKVWFAEYAILLHQRGKFMDALAHGTTHSRFGVIFTSDHSRTHATYTGYEVRQLTQSKVRCLRVMLHPDSVPSGQDMPPLDSIGAEDTYTYPDAHCVDVEAIVAFICARLFAGIAAFPPLPQEPENPDYDFCVQTPRWRYRTNTTNWKVIQRAKGFLPDGDFDGPRFRRHLGGCPVVLHTQFGLDASPARPLPVEGAALDDRAVFDDILDFAGRFLAGRQCECAGVHLFFLHGYSHAVVTYWNKFSWIRRYSIILPHPLKAGANCEIEFHFDFYGPFAALCNATAAMDSVVRTLQWGKRE